MSTVPGKRRWAKSGTLSSLALLHISAILSVTLLVLLLFRLGFTGIIKAQTIAGGTGWKKNNAEEINGAAHMQTLNGDRQNKHVKPSGKGSEGLAISSVCHRESNADFWAQTVLEWGSHNIKPDDGSCCAACQDREGCNVWVFCAARGGCGKHARFGECWLKQHALLNPARPAGARGPDVAWVSGALYTNAERLEVEAQQSAAAQADARRRATLREDQSKPLVYLDVAIKGEHVGRMEFVLFTRESPRAAENFRALCTGEKGVVPRGHEGEGKPYHFKGAPFYRIIDNFIDQSGAGTESIYGGWFQDDPGGLALRHDRGGLLSMANTGPDTNSSHFSILMAPAPHLDGSYTVFGELVSGWEVATAVNALAQGQPDNTAGANAGAVIVGSGQLR